MVCICEDCRNAVIGMMDDRIERMRAYRNTIVSRTARRQRTARIEELRLIRDIIKKGAVKK